jgi:hypothetical protein
MDRFDPQTKEAGRAYFAREKALAETIARNPEDVGAILKLCHILIRRDRPMKALAWIARSAVQQSQEPRDHNWACQLLIEIGDFDAAQHQASLGLALRDDSDLAALRHTASLRLAKDQAQGVDPALKRTYLAAMQHLVRGEAAVAGALFEQVAAAAPRFYPAWIGLRGALEAQGEKAAAEALADRWIAAAPDAAGIARIVMARRLKDGLIFDHHMSLPIRPLHEALPAVRSLDALAASPAAVLPLDPGGVSVTLDPVISCVPDGSDHFVLHHTTPEVFLAGVDNAALVGRGVVVDPEGGLVRELHGPNLSKYGMIDEGRTVAFDPVILRSGLAQVKVHDTPALLITGASDRSFGDWLLIFVPRLTIARAAGLRCPVVVADHAPEPFLELLRQLGVPDEDIIRHDSSSVSLFRKLYVPSWPLRDYLAPMSGLFEIFQDLALPPTKGPGRRIYMSRERVDRRRLVNEAEVRAVFERHGFEVVHPQDLSLVQMRELMADADYVATPYGSALLNLAMAGRKPTVIFFVDLTKRGFLHQAAVWLGSMGLRFAYVSGRRAAGGLDRLGIKDVAFRVSIPEVERAIASVGL